MKKADLIEKVKGTQNFSDFYAMKGDILKALEGPTKTKKKVR